MDVILELTDTYALDYAWAWLAPARAVLDPLSSAPNVTSQTLSTWQYKPATAYFSVQPRQAAYLTAVSRDNIYRQYIGLFLITWLFGLVLYFVFSSLSYWLVFDKETMKHPKFLKNQISLEIAQANSSVPLMSLFTAVFFLAEVRGHAKLYDTTDEGPGMWYNLVQFPLFLFFTDCFVYWIHRTLHHPVFYKRLHKPHHKWIMPTPFASYAFHPVDGFLQSVPYHVFPFIFPLQKMAYVFFFVFINFWTILIHDGEYYANNPIVNGAACHSIHHLAFNYNYGQYFTIWDRIGGSYREPDPSLFVKEKKMSKDLWKKQAAEMEDYVKEVEGEDDRVFIGEDEKKSQ